MKSLHIWCFGQQDLSKKPPNPGHQTCAPYKPNMTSIINLGDTACELSKSTSPRNSDDTFAAILAELSATQQAMQAMKSTLTELHCKYIQQQEEIRELKEAATLGSLSASGDTKLSYTKATESASNSVAHLLMLIKEEICQEREQREKWECMKYALKVKPMLEINLTVEAVRHLAKGWQNCRQYIREVEKACPLDKIRVALVHITVEKEVLQLLRIDEEFLNNLTWEHFKKRLLAKVPAIEQTQAECRLLKTAMTSKDDVEVFTSHILTEYEATCQLFGTEQLDITVGDVLEHTITKNMTAEGQLLFAPKFRSNLEVAINKVETVFQDPHFKESMFLADASTGRPTDPTPVLSNQEPYPHHKQYRRQRHGRQQEGTKMTRKRKRCHFFDLGICRYGNLCHYRHSQVHKLTPAPTDQTVLHAPAQRSVPQKEYDLGIPIPSSYGDKTTISVQCR